MADIEITEETTPGDLRKAYEKQKQAREAAEQRLRELEAKERQATVADILKAKGAPAKAAKFYSGEADEASVVAWLKENEELFPTSTTTETTNAQKAATTTQVVTDPNVLAAQRLAEATANVGQEQQVFSTGTTAGAPITDTALVEQMMIAMKNIPDTPQGYEQLVKMGLFPANPNQV